MSSSFLLIESCIGWILIDSNYKRPSPSGRRRRPATRRASGADWRRRSIIRSLEPPVWGCSSGEQCTSTFSTNQHHHHHHYYHRRGETARSASEFQYSIDLCVAATEKNIALSAAAAAAAGDKNAWATVALLFITTGPRSPAAAQRRLDCMHCRPQTSTDDRRQLVSVLLPASTLSQRWRRCECVVRNVLSIRSRGHFSCVPLL